ncbi:hypothetical protein F5Y16DRAFT_373024 [Xylariaceae sp. FL0255]|nr:hypothetical protein F5Y16DRAFT_373024 [Xylariaceae sp. FL0255]
MGLTRHMYDISLAQITPILYWTNIVYSICSVPTAAAKLSVLFQLRSIFTTGNRNAVYWVIVVSIAANAAFYTSLFSFYVFYVLHCTPRDKIWLGDAVAGICTDAAKVNLSTGTLNIFSDVEALLIPTWAIWHLSMPINRKLAALSVFGVSLIAIAIGIGGLYLRVVLLTNSDETWWLTKLVLIAATEVSIVIFVGCMPFFSRLYRNYRGNGPTRTSTTTSKAKIITFGSTEKLKKIGKGNKLTDSLAKYMGPRGYAMTKLDSQGGGDDEDKFELRKHIASTASAGVATPGTYHRMSDLEGNGRAIGPNPNGAPSYIWKTSQVD